MPTSLKIGGHIYQVRVVSAWEGKDDGDFGMTDPETQTIYIYSKLAKTEQEATLIHEIFHVINHGLTESLLDSLSEQMYQVLKDNEITLSKL